MFGPQGSPHKGRPRLVLGEKSEERCSGGVSQFVIESDSRSATISAHSGPVDSISFAPDGQTLVSGGRDSKVKLWRVPTWELPRTPQGHEKSVRTLSLSPDGQFSVPAITDTTVSPWSLLSGEVVETLDGHRRAAAYKGVFWCWLDEVPFVCARPRRWNALGVVGGGVVQ